MIVWTQQPRQFALLTDWDAPNRKDYLKKVEDIVKGQLDNAFLLKNFALLKEWNEMYRNISNYYFVSAFYPRFKDPVTLKKDLDHTWINCFVRVNKLSMGTNAYLSKMAYNISGKSHYKDWYFNSADSVYTK